MANNLFVCSLQHLNNLQWFDCFIYWHSFNIIIYFFFLFIVNGKRNQNRSNNRILQNVNEETERADWIPEV